VGRIPFVAADVGGIAELIAPEDKTATLFGSAKNALRERLATALGDGVPVAQPATSIEENRRNWKKWHAGLSEVASFAPAIVDSAPLVSVCISTFDRPQLCAMAVQSVMAQSYRNIELVLVDDASRSAEARRFIAELASVFKARNWLIIENEAELWTGASRNRAAAVSSGDFVLLMDDDNLAKPHEVETFVQAALATGADILTCQQQPFGGNGAAPPFDAELPVGFMPVGANLPQALYENCLGDLNMMVRRQAWEELGGFTDERCGCEDYEFLARAVLAGYRLECVPEILFFYRMSSGGLAMRYSQRALYDSFMRALRPFVKAVPGELELGVMLAATSRRHAERLAEHGYWGKS
jgi:GT2 family glycosyltransferase